MGLRVSCCEITMKKFIFVLRIIRNPMKIKPILTLIIAFVLICCACTRTEIPGGNNVNTEPETPEQPTTPEEPEKPAKPDLAEGTAYVWDESVIPEIHVSMTESEWNALLQRYDQDSNNADYFHCNVSYVKGTEETVITDAGIKLRGNTSRRRPEGNAGEMHRKSGADWHHCHFALHFRKFVKDDAHTVKGVRKVNLKWLKDDPTYIREMYCYDLFRRAGVWTGANDVYCRLWLHIEGDAEPAYFGVYQMIEPVSDEFVKLRADRFGVKKGNLWKCSHNGTPADLTGLNADFSLDNNDGRNHTYEYKGDAAKYETALAQLKDFILKVSGKGPESFHTWIQQVCDTDLLLKTYAVNVACGMWDDHWNNGNNYYLFFTTDDIYDYKVFFIPYDYDNTLGTSQFYDSGRQNPLEWGSRGALMNQMMKHDDFKAVYKKALMELIDPANGLFDINASMARIKAWQSHIEPYVDNDTREDCSIADKPASWGNHGEYRLLTPGSNNFFTAKTESITQHCR